MQTTNSSHSKQLIPLRLEHQDGMLFVNRVKAGLDKVSIDRLRNYTRWFWKNHIRPHFFQEEKILLPYLPPDHLWAKKLQEDHADIRDLIIGLDQEADQQSFKVLCDLLDAHIRFEEQQLFAFIEQELSDDELNMIYNKLEQHPVSGEEWKDQFWAMER